MKKTQFDSNEYAKLKHRVEALQSRVRLDSGPEQETAKRLLAKVEKKLKIYEETHKIPNQQPENYSTTINYDFWSFFQNEPIRKSNPNQENHFKTNINFKCSFEDDKNYHEDTRSETEMIKNLGILYAIFGSTYQTALNYHVYKVRFKKQIDKSDAFYRDAFYRDAFYRVFSDVYEDDIRICKDVIIGFWPFTFGDDKCGSMEFSSTKSTSFGKYNECPNLYGYLLDTLMDMWNLYFNDHTSGAMLIGPAISLLENSYQSCVDNKLKVQLNSNQRKAIIDKTENEIRSGKMDFLKSKAFTTGFTSCKPYDTLSELLEESGVVYKVEASGVYIWEYFQKNFGKLIGYEYDTKYCDYCLYLI